MIRDKFCYGLCVAIVLTQAAAAGENWSRFRGANGTGISTLSGVPVSWSEDDYAWNIELPGLGHSSPVIWEDTLFVTSAIDEGAVRYLHCLDAATGKERWTRAIGLNRSHKHRKNSWASSTPATDGEYVYVAFADADQHTLAAYDFSGDLVWRQQFGEFMSQHGQGTSPIVHGDLVILPNDQMGTSNVFAVNRRSGRLVWASPREIRKTSYATPMILEDGKGPTQLICLSGAMGVTSLNPQTGDLNWKSGQLPLRTVASPIVANGLVIASCGSGGVGRLLVAVDPSAEPDSAGRIRYERSTTLPYVPTPVAWKDHLYLWTDKGVVSCVNLAQGEDVWTKRVRGNYSGSPVCIDGRLYCMSEEGDVVVVAASPEYKVLGRTALGDPSHSTPAVAGGRVYLRTFHRLMCLAAGN